MTRIPRAVLTLAVATVSLIVVNRIMNPAPIPAVGTIAGGLIISLVRDGFRWLAIGALAGWLLGIFAHTYSHLAEGRVTSGSELVSHVGANAGLGLVVGGLVLGIVAGVDLLIAKVFPRSQRA